MKRILWFLWRKKPDSRLVLYTSILLLNKKGILTLFLRLFLQNNIVFHIVFKHACVNSLHIYTEKCKHILSKSLYVGRDPRVSIGRGKMKTKKNEGKKHFLTLCVLSVASGFACAFFSIVLDLEQTVDYWFLLGTNLCFLTVGYIEGIEYLGKWNKQQPAFLGFRYWIKKTLRGECGNNG